MKKFLSMLSLAVLCSCSSPKQEYTTDYLFEHDDVRNQVLEDCKNNKQSENNCQNATVAKAKKFNTAEGKTRMKTDVVIPPQK